ncbi:Hypothetical_protein [Hexamita inflata]|uniref:Hypothetical_protein n=1 Tax=Hexamita inflata TaxID=28002 RepID=A0AA86RYD4_9EUKA|nr:Hypothetical protein HINF_LOCUS62440 [Hexamita inflata]
MSYRQHWGKCQSRSSLFNKPNGSQISSQLISSKLVSFDSDIAINVPVEYDEDTQVYYQLALLICDNRLQLQSLHSKIEGQMLNLKIAEANYCNIRNHAKWMQKILKK